MFHYRVNETYESRMVAMLANMVRIHPLVFALSVWYGKYRTQLSKVVLDRRIESMPIRMTSEIIFLVRNTKSVRYRIVTYIRHTKLIGM